MATLAAIQNIDPAAKGSRSGKLFLFSAGALGRKFPQKVDATGRRVGLNLAD
jgi:hypothetical protein